MKVPFLDLYAQYRTIKPTIDAAIASVIETSSFVRGPSVEAFETAFAETIGMPHCISCANGTDALYIALRGLGCHEGDEVITTAHSWIATSETISQCGAKVVFCDTDIQTFTIDPGKLEALITPRTRGLVVVHLYGQPASVEPIMEIAARHGLWVVEDCAQAHLARYRGRYVGTFGVAATFSFYPGKNLGAMGDAGCIVTGNDRLARFMAMFARHGGLKKGDHEIEGINSRLDGLQAAVLLAKLPHLKEWTAARQHRATRYDAALAGIGDVITPRTPADRDHVYHLYVIRTAHRDALKAALASAGIESALHYPVSLPFLKAYERFGHQPADFPSAFAHQQSILSLPLYPEMSDAQQTHVIDTIRRFFADMSTREVTGLEVGQAAIPQELRRG